MTTCLPRGSPSFSLTMRLSPSRTFVQITCAPYAHSIRLKTHTHRGCQYSVVGHVTHYWTAGDLALKGSAHVSKGTSLRTPVLQGGVTPPFTTWRNDGDDQAAEMSWPDCLWPRTYCAQNSRDMSECPLQAKAYSCLTCDSCTVQIPTYPITPNNPLSPPPSNPTTAPPLYLHDSHGLPQ